MWLLGATLFAHVVGFFGISYWDSNECVWFAFLAMISAATAGLTAATAPVEKAAEAGEVSALLSPIGGP
jgi:cyanate permease